MLKTKEQIEKWLNKHQITDYSINDDLAVDVNGNVDLSDENLTEIPVQFNKVNGNFYCDNNKLRSLVGSPKELHGTFWCHSNQLTSLEHLPEIHGELVCDMDLYNTREYKVWQIGKQLREMV